MIYACLCINNSLPFIPFVWRYDFLRLSKLGSGEPCSLQSPTRVSVDDNTLSAVSDPVSRYCCERALADASIAKLGRLTRWSSIPRAYNPASRRIKRPCALSLDYRWLQMRSHEVSLNNLPRLAGTSIEPSYHVGSHACIASPTYWIVHAVILHRSKDAHDSSLR